MLFLKEGMCDVGKKARGKALNLPNALSLTRVFLAPLVLLFLSLRSSEPISFLSFLGDDAPTWGDILAGGVFVVAAITDSLDGYIARKQRLVTTLGKMLARPEPRP